MDNGDLPLLLRFAELIQHKLKNETDEKAKSSLERDLKLVKNEIGKRILDLPEDVPIFPPLPEEKFSSPIKESISSIHIDSPTKDMEELGSPIQNTSIQSLSGQSSSILLSTDDIAAKFNAFIKSKNSSKPKSKIPIPKAK
ncbi:hypothetical protein TRFO_04914 [Tritrichomonas foetus]|uniref:Uncharacterized protein n=1 Tax=Tritrichomonas foetus TaxID=1144522 RepID=A0A1J4KG28_9EUKA|nr:hypothetical protein TRFO_04914 [Tritrichomonas foetus]|eukprot:OHT08301.1 hypothetical protein TRFO_04914 [Tritrichomonas foetus]